MVPSQSDLTALRLTVESSSTILAALDGALSKTPTDATSEPLIIQTSPLDLLEQSSSLIRAQSTKISLLIINEPFTPSEICRILRELSTGALPAMVAAAQQCGPQSWGKLMHREVTLRVQRVLQELGNFIEEIPVKGNARAIDKNEHVASLASTGIVWEACDSVIVLKALGMPGLLSHKINQWHDTFQDAISELRDWSLDVASDREDSGDEDIATSSSEAPSSIFATKRLPKTDTTLQEMVAKTLKQLKLVAMLYPALTKRRIPTLPWFKSHLENEIPTTPPISELDTLLSRLKAIPEHVDELVSFYYDLDGQSATDEMGKIVELARSVVSAVRMDWNAKEDKFTDWSGKWEKTLEDKAV